MKRISMLFLLILVPFLFTGCKQPEQEIAWEQSDETLSEHDSQIIPLVLGEAFDLSSTIYDDGYTVDLHFKSEKYGDFTISELGDNHMSELGEKGFWGSYEKPKEWTAYELKDDKKLLIAILTHPTTNMPEISNYVFDLESKKLTRLEHACFTPHTAQRL